MQPQGRWVQRLDRTNTGVTVVASRVSRKLNVSTGELWNPTTCLTTIWICKGRDFQNQAYREGSLPQPLLQSLFLIESQELCSSAGALAFGGRLLGPHGTHPAASAPQRFVVSAVQCPDCTCCQFKSPPRKHSLRGVSTRENTQACFEYLYSWWLLSPPWFLISTLARLSQQSATVASQPRSLLKAGTKARFCPLSLSSTSDRAFDGSLPAGDGRRP
jgi:hypothetical protein